MKVFLMFKDYDLDLEQELPWNEQSLIKDLELEILFSAMASHDKFLFDVAKKVVLSGLNDLDTMLYRQNVLKDCIKNSSVVRDIYGIAVEAVYNEKTFNWGTFSNYPDSILQKAIEVLQELLDMLKKLKSLTGVHADKFESEGFKRFFTMLEKELTDEYFASAQKHLEELIFRDGVLISAELGKGNKGSNYILRKPQDKNQRRVEQIFAKKTPVYSCRVSDSDARSLSELNSRGINLVANALAQSNDHILSFFTMLQAELAFYVGCFNLHGRLTQKGEPVSFPLPMNPGKRKFSYKGLYDVCLALSLEQRVVGNDADTDNKDLVIVTGANQGGKSTFLRSVGSAQLMMQCGMFVPAVSFCSSICDGLFTHYKREEDAAMKSGKLDEELSRMSDIADNITPDSMVLFNESFAATNEREGSEIARQITGALLEKRIKVFFVTHLHEFAHGFYSKEPEDAIFLRAERQADGERTFKLIEGEPLRTSFGEDLYYRIFGNT